MRARIVMVNNDSSSLIHFSDFYEDFRQTNCGVPLRIGRPTLLKKNSRHMTSIAAETGDHLLRSVFSLDLARLQRPTRSTVLLFRAHTHGSMIHQLQRSYKRLLLHHDRICQHFFTPIDTNLFLSDCQIVRDATKANVFLRPGVHAISHDNLALSVHSRPFLDDLHGIHI